MKIKKKYARLLLCVLLIVLFLFILFLILKDIPKTEIEEKKVREAVFAGSWYPGTQEELNSEVTGFLDKIKKLEFDGEIKAIIVPHAGYAYSGLIAAVAFKQLDDVYETVFLLGPSHRYPLTQASIPDVTHYKTPLGEVKVSEKAKKMLKEKIINSVPEAHANEHSLEIEIPFLQKQLTNFEIIPILVGDIDVEQLKEVILKYLGEDDLIVVSVDLSHYHPYDEAKALDSCAIGKITDLNDKDIFEDEIDAPWAVAALLKIAKEKDWEPKLLYYANSGDVTGDKSKVVGYSAIIFVEKSKGLKKEEKEFLLKLAREKLESIYNNKEVEVNEAELTPNLKVVQGCFTTLNKHGNLRGCIGHILPQEELYKCIIDNIVSAALHDKRFSPVTEDELKDIEIEISVLSVPEKISFSSGEDLKSKLRPRVDGVVLRKGFYQSTYLPQVWVQLPNKENFLSSLCIKGGMSKDCWKDTSTEVHTYQAEVFEE